MEKRIIESLKNCPLFVEMNEIEIEMTLINTPYSIINLEAHDVYALAGMPCKYADIIICGTLVCRMASLSGKQVEVSKLSEGNIIAPALIFAQNKEMPVSVETISRVKILRLRPEELKKLIDNDEHLRMNFIRILSNINMFLTQKIKFLSLFTIKEKVAYLLLECAGEQGSNSIHLTRSRKEIADSFGIQKFSLLRVLSHFEKDGAITIKGKDITILDKKKILK